MFSMSMIASSAMLPSAIASPPSEKVFRLSPNAFSYFQPLTASLASVRRENPQR